MINIFAAPHEIILHAEKLFTIGGLPVTNAMLLGWIVSVLLVLSLVKSAKKVKLNAGNGFLAVVELAVDGITNLANNVMHDRARARKYAPFLLTLFFFILINNWFGLLPLVGTVSWNGQPLLRAWTSDLTGTLAIAVSSIIIIQIYAIRELKIGGYFKHYFSNKPWNPVNLFVGLLEVLGEFTRMASLSLRLFGNIFAGEVLLLVLASITSLGSPIATLPFIFMELFVGLIQAFVFVMLVIVYLTLAVSSHDEESHPKVDHPVAVNGAKASPATG